MLLIITLKNLRNHLQTFRNFHIVFEFPCFLLVSSFLLSPVLILQFSPVQYPLLLLGLFLLPLPLQPSNLSWSFLFRYIILSNFANLGKLPSDNAFKIGGVLHAIREMRKPYILLYSEEPLSSPLAPIDHPTHSFSHL